MCGRINGISDGNLIWNIKYHDTWNFSGELAPTQQYPIIRKKPGSIDLETILARWGLIPEHCQGEEDLQKYKSTFNARSETAHRLPTFRKAFQRQRSVIEVSGFYEWQKNGKSKTKLHIHSSTGGPLILAGLWDFWQGPQGLIHSFTLLTCASGPLVQKFHDRQPVILGQAGAKRWLEDQPQTELQKLLIPCPDRWLTVTPC
ncbi:SOS response-associated peptidase [Deinococcus roseus]|uniref:Abasic site processing protein n=1 Tax=Deinococcus roseus TaxID=392414 RepID=A0ABQ2DIP2_9DEIO|nr:SOS response-associated peptidase [Deinococcus roseus]GGJ59031.1 DUF159 family protein [Deinococcus roseus]